VREEDEREFEEFVGRSADRLLRSAVLLVGDRSAAEDLLQGALERTYRHWSRVGGGQPEAYVRRALVNAATSRWRRIRIREVPLAFGDEPEADVGLADHADRLSTRDGLVRALLTLPPRQRAVLVLRYLDDLPEAEVAAALGCSVGSVKSQASRGLVRLRDSAHLTGLRTAPADAGDAARPGPPPAVGGPGSHAGAGTGVGVGGRRHQRDRRIPGATRRDGENGTAPAGRSPS
jgi:RNA polymerase sigma-70 factor (sigma-E family)